MEQATQTKKPGQPEFTPADVELILDGLYLMEKDDCSCDRMAIILKTFPEKCCDDPDHVRILQKIKADMTQRESKMRKDRKERRKKVTFLKFKLMTWQEKIGNLPEFTTDELDMTLDALYAIEEEDVLPDKLAMFLKNLDNDEIHNIACDLGAVEAKLKKERKISRERITLLKAKIIQTQQDWAIDRLGDPDE